MELKRKHWRAGMIILVCAVFLRLFGGGLMGLIVDLLTSPEAVSLMLYLETGRIIRPAEPETVIQFGAVTEATEKTEATEATQTPAPPADTTPTPTQVQMSEETAAVFAPEDAQLVQVNSVCGYEADVNSYLNKTLSWDLKQDGPTVLILHSHGTESYTKTEDYPEHTPYRTRDVGHNVVSVGDRLVQILEAGGIHVIHDRVMHDDPSYNDAYGNARASIAHILDKYPSIRLVLDLHRDSVEDSDGKQVSIATTVNGKRSARLMMVVGTDASGLTHPKWPENMSLAVKLHAQLEKNSPGICRPISFRSQRFNQDLSPGALIVEVGTAGNTRQEALLAVEQLGQAILDIAAGTVTDG